MCHAAQHRFIPDALGRPLQTTTPGGNTYRNAYDALGRITQTTRPDAKSVNYAYTAQDQLASVTDPLGHRTNYTWNNLGDLQRLDSPDTGGATTTYDPSGLPLSRTDARSQSANRSYDAVGRLISITLADDNLSFSYDAGDRLTKVSNTSATLDFSYDARRRLSQIKQTLGGSALSYGLTFNSTNDDLQRLTYPSGTQIDYVWSNGLITGLTLNGSTLLSQINWHASGLPQSFTHADGKAWAATIDSAGRLTSYTLAGNTIALSYDAEGNIISSGGKAYQYDSLNRLIGATGGAASYAYSYDANGNRITQTVGSSRFNLTTASDSNRLTQITGPGVNQTLSHDAAGNRLSDGNVADQYNAAGRLIASSKGGQTWRYAYDGLGQRISKTAPDGTTTRYVYNGGGQLIGEYSATGTVQKEYIYLGNWPVAVIAGGKTYAIYPDHLGTPRAATDSSFKQIVWRWDNDEPFGANAANEDVDADGTKFALNLRFAGQYYDQETGRNYNYFRDYDSATGRYVQSDPIGLEGGLNTYAYVGGSPLLNVDPDGKLFFVAAFGWSAASALADLAVVGGATWWWQNHIHPNNIENNGGPMPAPEPMEARKSDKEAKNDMPSYARGVPPPSDKDKCGKWAEDILNAVFGCTDPRATARGPTSAYSEIKKACQNHRTWWK